MEAEMKSSEWVSAEDFADVEVTTVLAEAKTERGLKQLVMIVKPHTNGLRYEVRRLANGNREEYRTWGTSFHNMRMQFNIL